jgi:hypothetical protein
MAIFAPEISYSEWTADYFLYGWRGRIGFDDSVEARSSDHSSTVRNLAGWQASAGPVTLAVINVTRRGSANQVWRQEP